MTARSGFFSGERIRFMRTGRRGHSGFGARGADRCTRPVFTATAILLLAQASLILAAEPKDHSDAPGRASTPSRHSADYLSLSHVDAYLEFKGEFTYDKVKTSGGLFTRRAEQEQRNTEWRFEERVGLRLDGSVIDPSLMTFGGSLDFALTQNRFQEKLNSWEHTDKDSGHLLQFDLRADLFQGKKLSGSVYGLRQDDRIDRRFQPSLDERRTGLGTSWVWSDEKLPMEFSYDYLDTDREGNRDPSDNEHYTESTLRYGAEWIIAEHSRLSFSYEHGQSKQRYQGSRRSFDTTRDLFIVEHEVGFGQDDANTLRTLLHWQEESGDFARDFIEFGPQLTLRHGENLRTIYRYQFNRERYEGLDVETQRVDFQAIHQAYTNLTTTFNAFALYEDVEDDINTTQYGASVDLQYNRKNDFGHLYANLALAYDTEEVDGDNGTRVILNEAHVLSDPIAATLRNRNAVLASVVVTDPTNRRFFRHGLDYVIQRQGNVTRIARVRTGQIADGDTILVDYQFRTPSDGQLDTIRVDFGLEQRFANGLTPYYRLAYRNQEDDVSTGFLRRADRTDHHRFGATYEKERYHLGAEFEIFDDTVEPYDAFHLDGLLRIMTDPDHTMNASSRVSRFFFEDEGFGDRDVTRVDLELDHRWRLSDNVSTVERLAFRYQDDSVEGITRGWDAVAGLEYVTGDLSGELTVEYDALDLPGSREDDFGVFVRVRREFNDVFARR